MQFIKKLVILTGGGFKGTLMLEKNSFGVWGRLNLFGYDIKEGDRLVVISGGNLFVSKLSPMLLGTTFELGELDFNAVHAAVVGDDVRLYGSNCAKKLSTAFILDKVLGEERRLKLNESQFVKFSGKECEYFKEIAPPQYNDFVIADKNYFPAYLSIMDEEEKNEEIIEAKPAKREETMAKLMPHELERRYIHLMEAAATMASAKERNPAEEQIIVNSGTEGVNVKDEPQRTDNAPEEGVNISDFDPERAEVTSAEKATVKPSEKPSDQLKPHEETVSIKEARNLRDYREESAVKGRKATYFERSSEQLKKLLASNERYTPIERLIPGSRFVKINYDGQRYYLVGVIGSEYICYGVPASFSETPPEPLDGYARWLPFDPSNPKGDGFWMMYQDGVSGETLKS